MTSSNVGLADILVGVCLMILVPCVGLLAHAAILGLARLVTRAARQREVRIPQQRQGE